MVEILQKCLQQYSGVSILRARKNQQIQGKDDNEENDETSPSTAASELFEEILRIDTDTWDNKIRDGLLSSSDLSSQKLINEIQKTMENVVLGLENGSMAQRIQAEFLRELVTRVESVESKA